MKRNGRGEIKSERGARGRKGRDGDGEAAELDELENEEDRGEWWNPARGERRTAARNEEGPRRGREGQRNGRRERER